MPEPTNDIGLKLAYSIDEASPDTVVEKAGSVTTIGVSKMAFLGQVGLSVTRIILDANAVHSPVYAADGAVSVTYVVRGSGHVQIVGLDGKQVLDSEVQAGQMFVVPRLFVVAKLAGDEGMECFSVLASSEAIIQEFASKASVWAAFSPQVVEASLNVNPKSEHSMP